MAEQKQTYTVLICETEEAAVAQMKQTLEGVEWQIVGVAASENEAVELARQHKPDIIVMALTLEKEQDGFAATRRILELYQTAIAIISANTEDAVVEAALKAGACAFLPTPLDMTKFTTALTLAKTRLDTLRNAMQEVDLIEAENMFGRSLPKVSDLIKRAQEAKIGQCTRRSR